MARCSSAFGLYPRQLPIPGLHTKWLERNRTVIFDMMLRLRPEDRQNPISSNCADFDSRLR